METNFKELKKDYGKFKESATALNDEQNTKLFHHCMQHVLDSRGQVVDQEDEQQDQIDNRNQKRMFSYKQIFDLHKILNNNSDVHDRVTTNENHIKQIFNELDNVKN